MRSMTAAAIGDEPMVKVTPTATPALAIDV
jgi:hypothetical protein